MLPTQEIVISTNNDSTHKIYIIEDKSQFYSEIVFYDALTDSKYFIANLGYCNSISDAFDVAYKWVFDCSTKKNQSILKINNPCNCELLSLDEQQKIVYRYGISVQVEVNA